MAFNTKFNRRDFLKLTAAGIGGLFLPEPKFHLVQTEDTPRLQGRVTVSKISVYNSPTLQGTKIGTFYYDNLLPISEEVIGGEEGDYNRLWFRIGESGYVYSGNVQLVENIANPIIYDIPASGMIGEISVPYAESWWGIHRSNRAIAYRLYYQTTHWIKDVFRDPVDGSPWYRAYHNQNDSQYFYYIRPQYVHLIPAEELSLLSADVPAEEKRIHVLLDEQLMLAFEGDRIVHQALTATGRQGNETPTGDFSIFHKRPSSRMAGGDGITSAYDLFGVPWNSYITEEGIALHGTFWHSDFGKPRSFGCINLPVEDARWVYRWTLPIVPPDKDFIFEPGTGTQVIVAQNQAMLPARSPGSGYQSSHTGYFSREEN